MNGAAEGDSALQISLGRGNIYIPREIYDAYLPGIVAVALLARNEEVLILPLSQQSAGGLLLKQRNIRGDRVIHAQEFFRRHDFTEEFGMRSVPVRWSPESAGLVVGGVRSASSPSAAQ